jgi:hypothetical protein
MSAAASSVKPPCLGCQSDAQPAACGVATVNAFMSAAVLFAIDPKQVALYIGSLCDAHRATAARVLVVISARNDISTPELVAKLQAAYGIPALFTCPKCGRTSHNPNDLVEGYCGACHDWTGRPDA